MHLFYHLHFPNFMQVQEVQKRNFKSFLSGSNVYKVSVIKDNIRHVVFVILFSNFAEKAKEK